MRSLPLVTLYLTDRCNSRCVTCDYWRTGRDNMTLDSVERLLPSLERMNTRAVLLSGGEPLLNSEWRQIARVLLEHDMRLWLLTSGLSLAKHAVAAASLFHSITVSLDGTSPQTYAAIRGLDAFENVCAGISAAAREGAAVAVRVTVQRSNYRELPRFVTLAAELGASQVSFLAVDVSNPHAFGRAAPFAGGLALDAADLGEFEDVLDDVERRFAAEFASGFIAEHPAKLRRIHAYFRALLGAGDFPPVRCNAPEFSAVVQVNGDVAPCFFIAPPAATEFDGAAMRTLRAAIRAGQRPECSRCVCSLWREPAEFEHLGAFDGERRRA